MKPAYGFALLQLTILLPATFTLLIITQHLIHFFSASRSELAAKLWLNQSLSLSEHRFSHQLKQIKAETLVSIEANKPDLTIQTLKHQYRWYTQSLPREPYKKLYFKIDQKNALCWLTQVKSFSCQTLTLNATAHPDLRPDFLSCKILLASYHKAIPDQAMQLDFALL